MKLIEGPVPIRVSELSEHEIIAAASLNCLVIVVFAIHRARCRS